jgi:hypothetical protein
VVVGAPPMPTEAAEIKDLDDMSSGDSSEEDSIGRPTIAKKAFAEVEVKSVHKISEESANDDKVSVIKGSEEIDDEMESSARKERKKSYDLLLESSEKPELLKVKTKRLLEEAEVESIKSVEIQRIADENKPRPDSGGDGTDGISPLVPAGIVSGSNDFGLGLSVKANLVINPDLFTYIPHYDLTIYLVGSLKGRSCDADYSVKRIC